MSPETKLCLASALRGTMFLKDDFDKELATFVSGALEDWFNLCPTESSQWFAADRKAVLAEVAKADQQELSEVLQDMGFSVNENQMVMLEGSRWEEFIDEQVAIANQSVRGNQRWQEEFSLATVKGILQKAIDGEEPEQIASLWAAYLFGFNPSRVTGAEGAGDAIILEFPSGEEREAAVLVYRRA